MVFGAFKRMLDPTQKMQRVELKEIHCTARKKALIDSFKTSAVGVGFANIDGSKRQEALAKLKVGSRVRLIWNAGAKDKDVVYLVRKVPMQRLSMSECFGLLNDKVAADVVRWITKENISTSARVVKIVGGTRKQPKKGCMLELRTYQESV